MTDIKEVNAQHRVGSSVADPLKLRFSLNAWPGEIGTTPGHA
jgi:hypothetical protein